MTQRLRVCAVYDSAVEVFNQPMFVPANGLATRSFTDEVNRAESPLNAHPGDFELYHLADFDPSTGRFESFEPIRLMRAVDVHQGGS